MKDIEDMNLSELADDLTTLPSCSVRPYVLDTIDRLRVLHDLTRWIPVSERLPTKDDADLEGYVLVRGVNNDGLIQNDIDLWNHIGDWNDKYWELTHWKRITPPEGV
jgi:hypothetical protein